MRTSVLKRCSLPSFLSFYLKWLTCYLKCMPCYLKWLPRSLKWLPLNGCPFTTLICCQFALHIYSECLVLSLPCSRSPLLPLSPSPAALPPSCSRSLPLQLTRRRTATRPKIHCFEGNQPSNPSLSASALLPSSPSPRPSSCFFSPRS